MQSRYVVLSSVLFAALLGCQRLTRDAPPESRIKRATVCKSTKAGPPLFIALPFVSGAHFHLRGHTVPDANVYVNGVQIPVGPATANYMRRGRSLPITKAALLERFEKLATNEDLVHNASECRKMLLKAYP